MSHLQGLRAREGEEVIYRNSDAGKVIDEYIHNFRDREIIRRRLIDGVSIERLAEEFDRSPRAMQRKVAKLQREVFLHMK